MEIETNDIDIKSNIQYEYTSTNLKIYPISIHKEILRSIIIKNLIKIFVTIINEFKKTKIKNFGKIFKYNKLQEYVQRWCWLQYNNPTIQDSVIPYLEDENYNFDDFINDFNYILFTNIDKNNEIIKKLINTVKIYLKTEYNKFQQINEITIPINKIKNYDNVILKCIYKNNKYSVVINNNVYIRLLKKLIKFDKKDNDEYIFCLFFRYSYIDAENQQLAIHSKIKNLFKDYCGVDFELFGSGINVLSSNYCSLFYDIEKFFGSKGNFFNLEIQSGIYWCNPPYDNTIMTNTSHKLIEIMNSKNNIAFIMTIPIWDSATQKTKLTNIIRNFNKDTCVDEHKDYQAYSLLKPYIKDEILIPKHRIPYFNYKHYKPIYARDTYMLILYKNLDNNTNLHKVFDIIIELDKTNYFILNN
jgi:hypothetical protein